MMADKIIWCSYWGTFSRVLKPAYREEPIGYVELNLTPVNGVSGDWDRVRWGRIRRHGTSRSPRDTLDRMLPKAWFNELGERVGKDARHFLMTADIMSMIDWDKYRKYDNGGCDLHMCVNDLNLLPEFMDPLRSRTTLKYTIKEP